MKSYSLYQPPPRFRWPDDSKCCVMLCFDVDGETTALSEDPTLKNRLTTYSQTTGQQIATYFRKNPDARHEIDFDREEVAGNNVRLSLSSHERWST
jgi:hypothetical protein